MIHYDTLCHFLALYIYIKKWSVVFKPNKSMNIIKLMLFNLGNFFLKKD